jgi:hypothetical protein
MGEVLEFEEVIAQPYANCAFSAGFVTGHPHDTLYLRLARDGQEPTTLLLRPDEAAALAWCLTGVLWSERVRLDGSSLPKPVVEEAMGPERIEALSSLAAKINEIVDAETYEAVQDATCLDCWRVEAIDFANEGVCYVAIFSGPNAEQRAREYADWKNASLMDH